MEALAKDYLRGARARLIAAEDATKRGDYPETVRYSQECVELSLKACLRMAGVEYPKVHDVGGVLKAESSRFPSWFRKHVERLAEISRDLAEKRAPSMYGIEAAGKTPGELFGQEDAEEALEAAKYVHELARKLIGMERK
ncbi:MAG: HEPN domain-containing protein [Thaumarchaeota archaeon]|nr:HEPN domain-containing protein [Nitrososphaerota archaeon]